MSWFLVGFSTAALVRLSLFLPDMLFGLVLDTPIMF